MVTIDNLPLYDARIDGEGCGMFRISLVDDPAVMTDFLAFRNAERVQTLYAVQDEEKRIVRGVVMRADFPIYRNQPPLGEFYVMYSAETIREMAQKYLAENRANLVDLMHDGKDIEGVEMVQFFIKDAAAGIDPAGFEGIADGSLFAEFKINDDNVWKAVKDGTYKGFSLEGVFALEPVPDSEEAEVKSIVDSLDGIFKKIFSMNKIQKIKAAIARALVLMGSTTTDKGVIYWDGEEDLKAGDAVYTGDDRTPAEDGDYKTEDGKTVRVADGKVTEIIDPEAEVAPEPEEKEEEEVLARRDRVRQAFAESYEEKEKLIYDAIVAAGYDPETGYLFEAGEDFAVWCWWKEDEWVDRYLRFPVSWNEDGTASVGEPEEVVREFVPEDRAEEISEEDFQEVMQAVNELKEQNAALKARVAELEKQPATTSAREQFRAAPVKTGDKGLDRLAARFGRK